MLPAQLVRGSTFWTLVFLLAFIAVLWHTAVAWATNTSDPRDSTVRGPATVLERDPDGNTTVTRLASGDLRNQITSRLGLHVTAEELSVWRDRWEGGVTGDSFLNARISEEKSRITNNKNSFMSNPGGHLWNFGSVPTNSSGCIDREFSVSTQRVQSARMRDAAFYGLVTRDAAVLDEVKDTLLRQPEQSNVDWSRNPWCPSAQSMIDAAVPGFSVSHVTLVSLFTYDYLQIAVKEGLISDFTTGQNATLEQWYLDFADYLMPSATFKMGLITEDWENGGTTLTTWALDPNRLWHTANTYQGGPQVHSAHNLFNNRRASTVRYVAVAGVKFRDENLTLWSKRWLGDFIRYHVYPHGAVGDMHRGWNHSNASLGYPILATSHTLTAVDTIARAGDTSLYELSTTDGLHDSAGGPHHGDLPGKSYEFLMQTMTRYSDGTFTRYNSNGELYSFDNNNRGYHDRLIVGNLYYQDPKVQDFYRGNNGMHPWRQTGNGTTDLNDSWAYPSPYLMTAGLEGQIWPYPATVE